MTTKFDKNNTVDSKNKDTPEETSSAQQFCYGFIIFCECMFMIFRVLVEIGVGIYRMFVQAEEKSVKGEIVMITGCGHGIGKELALQYAALGATVVGWDLNMETNQQTMTEIAAMGGPKGHAYQCDVTNREQVMQLAKRVQKEVGEVSILINNAGIMPCHSLQEHTEQEITKVFEINVYAHFWMIQAFMPSMIERNHGHIVGISSMAGITGNRNMTAYCATKYAVRGLMEALSEEIRESGSGSQIKFTTICPFIVDTGLCKHPKVRFPSLVPVLSAKIVAENIISAQRRNVDEISVPSYMLYCNFFVRLLPLKCGILFKAFMDTGAESDKL